MTTTHVQLFATAGPKAVSGPGFAAPTGMEGLFAQLVGATSSDTQPFTTDQAANIAQSLSPELASNLPSDPAALQDLLSRVKQALDKGNTTDAAALLAGTKPAADASDTTLQNLPTETAPVKISTAKAAIRSSMVTFQPQDVLLLLNRENLVLQTLGHGEIDLTQGFDPAALTDIYEKAGLSPEDATARVELIGKMVKHLTDTPDQPFTVLLPNNVDTAQPIGLDPLSGNKQDFLSAIQAAAQMVAPDSEEIVTQILSLESPDGVDENGDPITKTVNVPIVQNIPVLNPQGAAPVNETKTASEALADLALGAKPTGMQTRASAPAFEKSASTAEGQIVDTALNDQPAAHLLASVERSDVSNGVATHSGGAISVAAYSEGQNSFANDERSHTKSEVEGINRSAHDTAAMSFDRVLGQKLEAQLPTPVAYTSHGKIPTPGEQVSVSVRQLAEAGGGEVRIKLMPEELGRVDIRLEIHNSQVRGVVMVERPEVLGDLARDLKHLQQALAATGLTMADNALSFQMQNQGGDQGQSRDHHAPLGGVAEVASGDEVAMAAPGPWRDVTKLVDVNI